MRHYHPVLHQTPNESQKYREVVFPGPRSSLFYDFIRSYLLANCLLVRFTATLAAPSSDSSPLIITCLCLTFLSLPTFRNAFTFTTFIQSSFLSQQYMKNTVFMFLADISYPELCTSRAQPGLRLHDSCQTTNAGLMFLLTEPDKQP